MAAIAAVDIAIDTEDVLADWLDPQ